MEIKKTTDPRLLIRRLKSKIILTGIVLSILSDISAQTIPANFFGMNYWMPYNYINTPSGQTAPYPNGVADFSNIQTLVKDAGASFIRIGGNGYDESGTAIGTLTTDNDYIAAMSKVLVVNPNANFLVQIPFEWGITTANARVLVANVEAYRLSLAPAPIPTVYYTIGNEWDIYPTTKNCTTAVQIRDNIKAYALEMKKEHTYNIKIVGPSLTSFYAKDGAGTTYLMQSLIGGAADITGIIPAGNGNASGKPYIDVVDYHTYAGGCNGDMSTSCSGGCPNSLSCLGSSNWTSYRDRSIDYPNGGANVANGFNQELSDALIFTGVNGLRKLISDANTLNGRTSSYPLTFAITEMNVTHKNPPTAGGTNGWENGVLGIGCRSFFAGQYWADMISSILKNGGSLPEFVMPWSIHESSGNGTTYDLSMTSGTASSSVTPQPLSTYWHYQMVAKNFAGTYLPNSYTNSANYKAFAYNNSATNEIGVLIMNQLMGSNPTRATDTHTKSFKINFSSTSPSGIYDMKFAFAGGGIAEYNCNITVETTMLLVFDATTGALKRKQTYSLRDALRTTDTGALTNIPTSTIYDNYTDPAPLYSDITIGNGASITAGYNKVFTATNSIKLNGPFSSNGKTLSLLIDHATCYSNP